MNANNRADIIKRMQKLAKMTIANGASENEAMFAARMMRELQDEYNINQDELSVRQDAVNLGEALYDELYGTDDNWHIVFPWIAKYTNTKAFYYWQFDDDILGGLGLNQKALRRKAIKFFGYPEDCIAAISLSTIISHAINLSSYDVKRKKQYTRRNDLISFRYGMAERIKERLKELIDERDQSFKAATGTALIILKDQIVTEEFAKRYPDMRARGFTNPVTNAAAYAAGQAAGDNVGLRSMHNVARDTTKRIQ